MTGFTRAYAALDLAAEVAGKCTWVVGDVGAVLDDEGQFARLDDTFIQLDLARNHAEQERLQSRIDFLAGDMKRFEDLLERRTVSQAL
ncbi:MAG: hypothetical protein QNK37_32860 [Acidobacteriota bacterium]|nr:hypothetical protein [Acidobacteriota bacterium]